MILLTNNLPKEVDLGDDGDFDEYEQNLEKLKMITDLCNSFKPLIKVASQQQVIRPLSSMISGRWVFLKSELKEKAE